MAWTSPRTWVAGETLTAALLNQHVRDNQKAIGDAWTAYTPTLGNWTLGNGTWSAAYIQAGKLIHFRANLTVGSTTSISGSPTITLPVTAIAARAASFPGGAYDLSATTNYELGAFHTTTTVSFRSAGAALSSTVPFTWATGDEVYVSGTYEAA